MKEDITRYLLRITTYASGKDGQLMPIKIAEYETSGSNLYTLPDLSLFKDGVNFTISVEMVAKRIYSKSISNVGMIELEREELL